MNILTANEFSLLVLFLIVAYFGNITYLIIGIANLRDAVSKGCDSVADQAKRLAYISVMSAFTVLMVVLLLFIIMVKY